MKAASLSKYITFQSGPILESKGMHVIFQKKGQKEDKNMLKMGKKGKMFENLFKNV